VETRFFGSGLREAGFLRVVAVRFVPMVGFELRGWDESDLAVQSSMVEPGLLLHEVSAKVGDLQASVR